MSRRWFSRRFSHEMFQLGEDLLDGVQIGRVGGQEYSLGAGGANGVSHRLAFMASQIVERDNVAWPQCRNKNLLDISKEPLAIDRAVEHARRFNPVTAQRGQKGRCLPVAVRHVGDEPPAAGAPAPERRHVGLDRGFVDKNQTLGINLALIGFPARAMAGHAGAILLGWENAFFYN